MIISRSDVEQIAQLARLRLEPLEMETIARELGSILDHMRELETLDAEGSLHPGEEVGTSAPMRPDEIGADPLLRTPAEFAPAFEQDFFVVPRLEALDADALQGGGSA